MLTAVETSVMRMFIASIKLLAGGYNRIVTRNILS